jgi:hypothetical protein
MMSLPRKVAKFTVFRHLRPMLAIAAMVALVAPNAAGAARMRAGGLYDGVWNVVFATTRGTCGSGYSVPFSVAGGRVFSAGGGRVSGRVNRAGAVAVSVWVGATHASGGGRLVGNSGGGAWSGIIRGDRCGGTWQATRGY